MLFNSDYILYGRYAEIVMRLTEGSKNARQESNTDERVIIFNRNIDVIMAAALIGLHYDRWLENDHSSEAKATINVTQLQSYDKELDYIFKLMILTGGYFNLTDQERVDKAFRENHTENDEDNKRMLEPFKYYVNGGLDQLDVVFRDARSNNQVRTKWIQFLDRYNMIKDV